MIDDRAVRGALTTDDPRAGTALIVTVALGTMLAPLNSTMIAVALPEIAAQFGVSVATVGWLVITYLVAMAGVQPAAGTLGDRIGRRRLMLGGLIAFSLASGGAALAPTLPVLIVARVLQAVAGAVLVPNGTALVREVVPTEERARRFGQIGMATACAAAIGPSLGGLIVGGAGWRAIFAANLVLVLPALVLGWRVLPTGRPVSDDHRFDVVGAVWLTVLLSAAAAMLVRFADLRQVGVWVSGGLLLALIGGLVAFLRYELRQPRPALQPRLFQRRAFAFATVANALSNLAMYVTLLAVPVLLTRRGGWSSVAIGVLLTVLSAASVATAAPGGWLADRLGRRWPTVIGLGLLVLGTLPLLVGGGGVATGGLVGSFLLIGGGLGLASAAMQTGAVEAVDRAVTGAAAGLYSTSRYLGSIVGASLLSALLGPGREGQGEFATIFLLVALAAVGAVVAALGLQDWPGKEVE